MAYHLGGETPVGGDPRGTRPWTTFAVLACIFLAGALLVSDYHPMLLGVHWTDPAPGPFRTTDRLEIAAHGRFLKDRSTSLVCLADGPHLLVKARLDWGSFRGDAVERSERTGWTGYDSRLLIGSVDRLSLGPHAEMHAHVAYGPTVDRIISEALRPDDRAVLQGWFAAGTPGSLSASLGEFGIHRMRAVASRRDVDGFLDRCDRRVGPIGSGRLVATTN